VPVEPKPEENDDDEDDDDNDDDDEENDENDNHEEGQEGGEDSHRNEDSASSSDENDSTEAAHAAATGQSPQPVRTAWVGASVSTTGTTAVADATGALITESADPQIMDTTNDNLKILPDVGDALALEKILAEPLPVVPSAASMEEAKEEAAETTEAATTEPAAPKEDDLPKEDDAPTPMDMDMSETKISPAPGQATEDDNDTDDGVKETNGGDNGVGVDLEPPSRAKLVRKMSSASASSMKAVRYYCPYNINERDEDENTALHVAIHLFKRANWNT
jgi:hypothetical protein